MTKPDKTDLEAICQEAADTFIHAGATINRDFSCRQDYVHQ